MYGISFTLTQLFAVLGVTVLSLLVGNLFVLIITSFVKREQAMGAIGTIWWTMLGLVCGAYVPVGMLGETITQVFTLLPLNTLSRQVFFMNISSTNLPEQVLSGEYAKAYGYELFINDEKLSILALCLIVVAFIVLFGVVLIARFHKMKKMNDIEYKQT